MSIDVVIEPLASMLTSLQPSRYGPPKLRAQRVEPSGRNATMTQSDGPELVNGTEPKPTVPAYQPVATAPFASASMSKRLSSPGPPTRFVHSVRPNGSKRANGMSAAPALTMDVPPSVAVRSNLPVTYTDPSGAAATPSNSSWFVGPDNTRAQRTEKWAPGGTGG